MSERKLLTCGLDQLAETLGISKQRVGQLINDGTLPQKLGRNRYDVTRSVHQYLSFKIQVEKSAKKEEVNAAEVRLKRVKADREEFDLDALRGNYIHKDHVGAAWESAAVALRAGLLAVPSKFAPLLVAASTPGEMRDALSTAIRELLTDLAKLEGGTVVADADFPPAGTSAAVDGEPVGGSKKKIEPRRKRGTGPL